MSLVSLWAALLALPCLVASSLVLRALANRSRRRWEGKVSELAAETVRALDLSATVEPAVEGRLSVALALDAERYELAVDLRGPAGAECSLRSQLPAAAMAVLLRGSAEANATRLRTGDTGFDEHFAVDARAPAMARVLTGRVRDALLALPAGMSAPRLAIAGGVVELRWRGMPHGDAVRHAARLLQAVRSEFQDLIPLR